LRVLVEVRPALELFLAELVCCFIAAQFCEPLPDEWLESGDAFTASSNERTGNPTTHTLAAFCFDKVPTVFVRTGDAADDCLRAVLDWEKKLGIAAGLGEETQRLTLPVRRGIRARELLTDGMQLWFVRAAGPSIPSVAVALDAIERGDLISIQASRALGYAVDCLGAERRHPPNNCRSPCMNSDDAELRGRSGLDYNRDNIRTPITIDIHDYPRGPETKILEFVDGVSTDEIDGWIEQPQAGQSAQRLFKKRQQRWLIDSHCAQEEEDQALQFSFA
jgi:hypothetical protein